MNLYWFLLTTGWLVTVAILRVAVSEMAALAVSVVFGLIAEVMIVFVPALTIRPLADVLFVSLMSPVAALILWLGVGGFFGFAVWQIVKVAFAVVGWADNLMRSKSND